MIVVCQTVPQTLKTIKRLLGDRENVYYTSEHRQAHSHIRDTEEVFGRTVAILSENYHGEPVNGSMIALGIKGMRADAWCLLFTSERPAMDGVDGLIDKLDRQTPWDAIRQLVDGGIDDPVRIPTLEALYEAFPWIKRPR